MYKSVSGAQFLDSLRAIDDSVKNIRLSSVNVDRSGREISYAFICDKTVDEATREEILKKAEEITPPAFGTVTVSIKKIVGDPELVSVEIYRYLTENYPSISIFLKPTDVITSDVGGVIKYVLRLTEDGVNYALRAGIIKKLNDYLGTRFCAEFAGGTEVKENEETLSLLSDDVYESQVQKIEHRTIRVEDEEIIDDPSMGDLAVYIEDAVSGDVTVCGTVTEITERETKNGKPFFIIHIDDTTGKTSGVYFSKKSTLQRIRAIKVGDAIIAKGTFGEYNGRKSFTYERINGCVFPKNFVKKDKFKKTAPPEYKVIFPSAATTVKVKSVFDKETALPAELTEKVYVVFDLETTGLDLMNNGITEIGAVKIKDGKISEQFTTLIKPDYPITEEITRITGITEEMVKDSPKISAVIPDFIKFIDKTTLVAHNAEFDLKFIKRFAGAEEYEVKNPVMDTIELAKYCLPSLRHYDLHTVADRFGIVFHHHRALSDAYATAEAFIELMKLKKIKDDKK